MTVKITKHLDCEVHYHDIRIEFTGVEPMETEGFSHKGKQWVPDTATTRHRHGAPIEEITVYGSVVRRDGTVGAVRTDTRYVTPAHRLWDSASKWDRQAPTWLLELFGIEAP